MSNALRRHFTAEQKAAILKEHLLDKKPVSEICDHHRIAVSQFYTWQKDLFEYAHLALGKNGRRERADDAQQKKIEHLEAKIVRKDGVIAELMEEHVLLKKELGES